MNNIKYLLSNVALSGLFLVSVSALASKPATPLKPCPEPDKLDIVLVGNENMGHKSLSFPDGSKWDIVYTYNIHTSGQWGVLGNPHNIATERKPKIELVDQEDWELYGTMTKPMREVWRSNCNYEAFKPARLAESLEINDPFWRFSLFQQEIVE